jgi:hypothetical protein
MVAGDRNTAFATAVIDFLQRRIGSRPSSVGAPA